MTNIHQRGKKYSIWILTQYMYFSIRLSWKKQKQHLKILSNWLINFWFNICSWIFFHHWSLTKCMLLYSKFNVLVVQLKLWEENFCPEKTHKWKMMEKILKQLFVEKTFILRHCSLSNCKSNLTIFGWLKINSFFWYYVILYCTWPFIFVRGKIESNLHTGKIYHL